MNSRSCGVLWLLTPDQPLRGLPPPPAVAAARLQLLEGRLGLGARYAAQLQGLEGLVLRELQQLLSWQPMDFLVDLVRRNKFDQLCRYSWRW